MLRKMLNRMLMVMCVGLMLNPLGSAQSIGKRHDEPQVPPIELSQITLAFAVQNDAGQLVWETPQPGAPNTIPAGAQKLRFVAKVNNRPKGAAIRIRAVLQEVCRSPDEGKQYLARLRHLTESDTTGQQTPGDESDNEVQVIDTDGKIKIEVSVHCNDCVRATCGKECAGRDHLGEGPHSVTLTTSDASDQPRAEVSSMPAKPSSFRVNIMSVCPKGKNKTGRPATQDR